MLKLLLLLTSGAHAKEHVSGEELNKRHLATQAAKNLAPVLENATYGARKEELKKVRRVTNEERGLPKKPPVMYLTKKVEAAPEGAARARRCRIMKHLVRRSERLGAS